MYNPAAVDFERMKSERERLLSFHGNPPWPVSFIDPRDCARAGFFFIRDGDKVSNKQVCEASMVRFRCSVKLL